jgi:hypothetical protein
MPRWWSDAVVIGLVVAAVVVWVIVWYWPGRWLQAGCGTSYRMKRCASMIRGTSSSS